MLKPSQGLPMPFMSVSSGLATSLRLGGLGWDRCAAGQPCLAAWPGPPGSAEAGPGEAVSGGGTSTRRRQARSKISAGDRSAWASKKPRQIFRREFMQAEGPPAGNSPLTADLSTFNGSCRAEPAIMTLRQMFLPRSGCLPNQDPAHRRRRRSQRPSWVPLTNSGPSTEQPCSTVPDPE